MNNTYYMTMNTRNYICIAITVLGGILAVLGQVIIPVGLLVVIVTLFDGPLNKDIFVIKDKKLFLLVGHDNMKIRTVALGIIFLGFALCLSKFYMISLCIFYCLLLLIFLFNIIIAKQNSDFIKDKNTLIDDKMENYQTFEIMEVLDNKSSFTFKLKDKFTRESYELEYKLNKAYINYKELYNYIKTYKSDESQVAE